MRRKYLCLMIMAVIMLMAGIYLQAGREVSVETMYEGSYGDKQVEHIILVANKLFIWDKEKFAREIIQQCIDNKLHGIRFSYDYYEPAEFNITVYLDEYSWKYGKEDFIIHYTQDRENNYRYSALKNPEMFTLTLEEGGDSLMRPDAYGANPSGR